MAQCYLMRWPWFWKFGHWDQWEYFDKDDRSKMMEITDNGKTVLNRGSTGSIRVGKWMPCDAKAFGMVMISGDQYLETE